MVVDPFRRFPSTLSVIHLVSQLCSARTLRARARYMECFCNLDLAPDAAATSHLSPAHALPSARVAPHSCSSDAFDLLRHSWETSSAIALNSLASAAATSKAYPTPSSTHVSNSLLQASPFPSSALSSLSSSFLPLSQPTPNWNSVTSSVLPTSPPPPATPPPSLLETARRLPNDAAAYRVRLLCPGLECSKRDAFEIRFCECRLFMLHKFKAMLNKTTSALTYARCCSQQPLASLLGCCDIFRR